MKQRIIALCAVVLMLPGCTSRTIEPRFENLVADTLMGENPACRVDYSFATISNAGKSAALQAVEHANIAHFFNFEGFDGTAAEALQLSLAQTCNELAEVGVVFEGRDLELHVAVESEAAVVDSLVNMTISRSSYMGGAHGVYSIECHNYSLRDGHEIGIDDLFTHAEQRVLAAAIRTKLCENYSATDDEGLREAGFFPDHIDITSNFQPTADGLTFYYNPYDIGCYALGGIDVTLTKKEIHNLITKR